MKNNIKKIIMPLILCVALLSSTSSFAAGTGKGNGTGGGKNKETTTQETKVENKEDKKGSGDGTGDGLAIALEVTSTNPEDKAEKVSVDTDIKFTFSKNVINESVKENNKKLFSMKKASGENVKIDVIMADTEDGNEKREIIVKPSDKLEYNTKYEVKVDKGIKSKGDQITEEATIISFTTAEKDEVAEDNISMKRISGKDRFATAVKVSQEAFTNSDKIVIANGYSEIDSILASSLARYENLPVLFVENNGIPKNIEKEIARLKAKEIVIIGGEKTVSKKVEEALKAEKITRMSGKDRYDTSLSISKSLGKDKIKSITLVNGNSFADGLIANSLGDGNSIVLVQKDKVSKEVVEFIKSLNMETVNICGGTASVSKEVAQKLKAEKITPNRISGKDRYITSLELAKVKGADVKGTVFANGEKFADAVAAQNLVNKENMSLLYVRKDSALKEMDAYLKDNKIVNRYIIGGENSISTELENKLK